MEHKEKISKALRGRKAWNTGLKGYTNKGSFKKGQNVGEKNCNWKGDQVGYIALHKWIYRHFGKPKKCEFCGKKKKKYYWANKTGEYKRMRKDWIQLCMSCHVRYDNVLEKAWRTRRAGG